MAASREETIEMLKTSYRMELETVTNYLAYSINLDGVRAEEIKKSRMDAARQLWEKGSLDDWGNPLRPNNLNRGVYKGGRRPIDLYWRIAKGINGAKMPAHYPNLEPERIWDLVNFVLELPYEPRLLEGATLPSAPPATAPAVARR